VKGDELGFLLSGLAAILGVGIGIATSISAWRGRKDTNRITDRINEFQILEGTVDVLRANLTDAQHEIDGLRVDLADARRDCRKLRDELNIALANVGILSDHIREHVPGSVPWPRLRRMNGG